MKKILFRVVARESHVQQFILVILVGSIEENHIIDVGNAPSSTIITTTAHKNITIDPQSKNSPERATLVQHHVQDNHNIDNR
ncbi:hypothetical protein PGABG02_0004000 [Plasmodium sp. DRC-Itaito]|nr:hypothetical protein PGABG02_0004000 [Plasmodium sp. DRC-Itaito]